MTIEQAKSVIMRFGRYSGWPLRAVLDTAPDYIWWIHKKATNISSELRNAVAALVADEATLAIIKAAKKAAAAKRRLERNQKRADNEYYYR